MLTRADSRSSWPRLIGIASGMFGAALTVATLAEFAVANLRPTHAFATTFQQISSICGFAFFVLAFPLYTGREWARRALLVLTYCVLAALASSFLFFIVSHPRTASASGYLSLHFLIGVCALVSFITPPAFVLAVLHHADVRRTFKPQGASNQPLEPTADRANV
jgi:hypothetical protein